MIDHIQEFKQAAAAHGHILPDKIITDCSIHRFTVPGDRSNSNNGWHVLYMDNPAAGAFGSWKRHVSQTCCRHSTMRWQRKKKTVYKTKIEFMRRQRKTVSELKLKKCFVWCADALMKAQDAPIQWFKNFPATSSIIMVVFLWGAS